MSFVWRICVNSAASVKRLKNWFSSNYCTGLLRIQSGCVSSVFLVFLTILQLFCLIGFLFIILWIVQTPKEMDLKYLYLYIFIPKQFCFGVYSVWRLINGTSNFQLAVRIFTLYIFPLINFYEWNCKISIKLASRWS